MYLMKKRILTEVHADVSRGTSFPLLKCVWRAVCSRGKVQLYPCRPLENYTQGEGTFQCLSRQLPSAHPSAQAS